MIGVLRRHLLKTVGGAAALTMVLAACGSEDGGDETSSDGGDDDAASEDDSSSDEGDESSEGGGDEEPVTLTVSVWNFDETPEFGALFGAFEAEYPHITIEPVDILADDYPDKVTTMLAGGDTTDVITQKNVIEYSRYASRGQLLDISDVVESIDFADTLSGLEPFDLDGAYYGLPYRQDFWLIYYNKALFEEAGVEWPENATWDDYADLAAQLTEGEEGADKQYGAYHHTWRSVIQAISAAQTGGDQLGGDYSFFADQYEMAVGLQDNGYAMDFGTATSQQASYRTMFETEATAMLEMGTWYIAGILAANASGDADVDWGLAPMPQIPGSDETVTFGSPTAFAVNKNAENVDAAKLFVEFAAGPVGAEAIAAIGVVPALQSDAITEAYFGLEGMPEDELSKQAFAPDRVVLEMPVSDISSDVDRIINEEHQLIMVGDKSIEEGIASMNDRVQSEVLD